jgi:hypothetical protein
MTALLMIVARTSSPVEVEPDVRVRLKNLKKCIYGGGDPYGSVENTLRRVALSNGQEHASARCSFPYWVMRNQTLKCDVRGLRVCLFAHGASMNAPGLME